MEQTVYGDLLFFVNFCMDFQCLFLTARLLRRPFSPLRGALLSALGALYACAALFIPFRGIWALLCDLAVCFLMCLGCYHHKGQRVARILIPFALYFGVSAAVGGVMSAVAAWLSRIGPVSAPGGTRISSFSFFLLAAAGGLATYLWGRLCQRRAGGKRGMLRLAFAGRELCVEGLVDTGNLLIDPVGGRAVVILERSEAIAWLPSALGTLLREGGDRIERLPQELACRVRLLPTDTVTGTGMLLAIAPERALLDMGRGERAVDILVAPSAPGAVLHGCKALLPAALITE